jgi:hypothetical protein
MPGAADRRSRARAPARCFLSVAVGLAVALVAGCDEKAGVVSAAPERPSAPPVETQRLPDLPCDVRDLIGAKRSAAHKMMGTAPRAEKATDTWPIPGGLFMKVEYLDGKVAFLSITEMSFVTNWKTVVGWLHFPDAAVRPLQENHGDDAVLEASLEIKNEPVLLNLSGHALMLQTERFHVIDGRQAYASILQTTFQSQGLDVAVKTFGKDATNLRLTWVLCSQDALDKLDQDALGKRAFSRVECDARVDGVGAVYSNHPMNVQ